MPKSPSPTSPIVVGIDVGGPSKGFHAVALVGGRFHDAFASKDVEELAHWSVRTMKATVIAIDAPCAWSKDGRCRPAERRMMEQGIPSERQYEVVVGPSRFKLDFAVFCTDRSIGLECDGDTQHMRRSAVERGKRRSNLLQSLGWSMLHFTTQELTRNMPGTLQVIQESIAQYGGIWHPGE
jgi:very-short-patch-repair endonuclease